MRATPYLVPELFVRNWSGQNRGGKDRTVGFMGLAIMLACVGCWEEIHYVPRTETANESVAAEQTRPAEVHAPGASEPPPAPTESVIGAASKQSDVTAPPNGSELFEPQLPPAVDQEQATAESDSTHAAAESILPTPTPETSSADGAAEGEVPEPAPIPPTPDVRRLAWQAASKWTLAAAIYAKALQRSPHTPILDEALAAASEIGVELPQLPTTASPDDLEAAVIEGLRGELGVALTNEYADALTPAEAAAADLAVRSHLLLLTYSPRESDALLQAEGLRRAGEASGLPEEVWTPLVTLLEQRAPFLDVRQAVFDLHRGADAHLTAAAK